MNKNLLILENFIKRIIFLVECFEIITFTRFFINIVRYYMYENFLQFCIILFILSYLQRIFRHSSLSVTFLFLLPLFLDHLLRLLSTVFSPLLRSSSGFQHKFFLGILSSPILSTCPNHTNRLLFISRTLF